MAGPMIVKMSGGPGATVYNVTASASDQTLLTSNEARRGAVIYNDSSALLYIKYMINKSDNSTLGACSASSFTYAIPAGAVWEAPATPYVGQINGVWASATGAARITEY